MSKEVKNDKFAEWIRRFGQIKLAVAFGCHQATVESWAARRMMPSVLNMMKLVKFAKGEIEYSDIIEPYFVANPHMLER